MSANIYPIYSGKGKVAWTTTAITAANTAKDMASGTTYLAFTADSTNGSYVQRIKFQALGTNIQTVARVWINNGSDPTSAANNTYFGEITLSATTLSETSALQPYELALNLALPASYRIYVTIGTAVSAGYQATVIGGDYTL
jgi:hypothetical protein